jgi:hypothetical protein
MQTALSRLAEELELLYRSGSPVAGTTPSQRERIASVALRKIESFQRRGAAEPNQEQQVIDLAKGLVNQFEGQPELVGRLITDYRHVAAALLKAYKANVS